jgi:hypothetical protein
LRTLVYILVGVKPNSSNKPLYLLPQQNVVAVREGEAGPLRDVLQGVVV